MGDKLDGAVSERAVAGAPLSVAPAAAPRRQRILAVGTTPAHSTEDPTVEASKSEIAELIAAARAHQDEPGDEPAIEQTRDVSKSALRRLLKDSGALAAMECDDALVDLDELDLLPTTINSSTPESAAVPPETEEDEFFEIAFDVAPDDDDIPEILVCEEPAATADVLGRMAGLLLGLSVAMVTLFVWLRIANVDVVGARFLLEKSMPMAAGSLGAAVVLLSFRRR